MSVPNVAEQDNPRQEFTLDEMEESTREPAPSLKPEDIKTPEGKTLAEVLEHQRRLEESLKLSESARAALQASLQKPQEQPRQEAPQPEREPLTREKLAEIYQEDPIKAIAMMQDDAMERAAAHVEARLSQIQAGTVDQAENWAKQEFKDEFAVLGDQIEAFRREIPNQAVFTTKKGWEDLIAYVRGQRGNFEKYLEYKQNGPARTPERARTEAEFSTGFTPTAPVRSKIPEGPVDLDQTTVRIAMNLFPDLREADAIREYKRWSNIEAR
jgi:hypothetical protein